MKRKFVAAFLAMALIMSGSTMAWAAEGEEDNTSGLQENVVWGLSNCIQEKTFCLSSYSFIFREWML